MDTNTITEILRLGNVRGLFIDRCYNVNSKSYERYGGRGIQVEEPWKSDAASFVLWSLETGSSAGLHIDRIDNDGPYAPWNCRWVTSEVNQNNRSDTVILTAWGETKPLRMWAKDARCKATAQNLHQRIFKLGWEVERAIETPNQGKLIEAFGETKTSHAWEKDPRMVITRRTLESRLQKGWYPEKAITTPRNKKI